MKHISKFKILDLVRHILDSDNYPLMITGVVERPNGYTYLCTGATNTENEYFEQELLKYSK